MKKRIDINKISKEKLYELYLKQVEEIEEITAKVRSLNIKNEELLKTIENLLEKININKARQFSPKSEVRKEENIFNEAEKEKKEIKKGAGRKKGSKNFNYDYFEKHFEETIIVKPEEIKSMKNLVYIGEDTTYKLEYNPAKVKIIKVISEKYKNEETKEIYQAINNEAYPHSVCTPSLAANILFNKFTLGIPYYRQSQFLFNSNIEISRQDLCNYQMKTSEILERFYNYLKEQLINNTVGVIHADETTLDVIEVKEKSKCYMWLYTTSFYDKPIYIYEYQQSRSSDNPKKFLKNYKGWLMSDGYEGYNDIENVKNASCWVHARRNFTDITKTLKEEQLSESKANEIVILIDKLFRFEKEYRDRQLTASKIKENRNKAPYITIVEEIFQTLKQSNPETGSQLEKAINYMLKRENKLKAILLEGYLDISNNIAERAIKPFVIARKNFLFSNTEDGAKSSSIIFSIIQTARENGIDVVKYLTYIIEQISKQPNIDFETLLPWNLKNKFAIKV